MNHDTVLYVRNFVFVCHGELNLINTIQCIVIQHKNCVILLLVISHRNVYKRLVVYS